jgi:hypothetical protein
VCKKNKEKKVCEERHKRRESREMFEQYPFGLRRLMSRGTFLKCGGGYVWTGEETAASFRALAKYILLCKKKKEKQPRDT